MTTEGYVPEYRVVWRWKTGDPVFPFSRERLKVYKTQKGAMRLIDKLTSNGGRFTVLDDDYPSIKQKLTLDFVRLETRLVGPWTTKEEIREPDR